MYITTTTSLYLPRQPSSAVNCRTIMLQYYIGYFQQVCDECTLTAKEETDRNIVFQVPVSNPA